jgi:hypothetical protein
LVEHLTFNQGVEGSSPSWLTNICGSGSGVEHRLAKARVAGSNPVFRSRVKTFIVKLYNEGFFVFWNPGVSLYGNDSLATHPAFSLPNVHHLLRNSFVAIWNVPPKMYAGLEPRRIMKKRI